MSFLIRTKIQEMVFSQKIMHQQNREECILMIIMLAELIILEGKSRNGKRTIKLIIMNTVIC